MKVILVPVKSPFNFTFVIANWYSAIKALVFVVIVVQLLEVNQEHLSLA